MKSTLLEKSGILKGLLLGSVDAKKARKLSTYGFKNDISKHKIEIHHLSHFQNFDFYKCWVQSRARPSILLHSNSSSVSMPDSWANLHQFSWDLVSNHWKNDKWMCKNCVAKIQSKFGFDYGYGYGYDSDSGYGYVFTLAQQCTAQAGSFLPNIIACVVCMSYIVGKHHTGYIVVFQILKKDRIYFLCDESIIISVLLYRQI